MSWRIYLVETFLQAAYLFDDGRLLLHLNYSGDNNEITAQVAEQVLKEGADLCSDFAPPSPPNSQPDPGYSGTRLIHIYVTGGRAS